MKINTFACGLLLGTLFCVLYLGQCKADSSGVSPAALSKSNGVIGNDKALPNLKILTRKRRQFQICPTIALEPGQCLSNCHCGPGQYCSPSPYRSGTRRCLSRNGGSRGGRGIYGLWV